MTDILGKKIVNKGFGEGYVAAYDPARGITIKSFAPGIWSESQWEFCINVKKDPEDADRLELLVDALETDDVIDLEEYNIYRNVLTRKVVKVSSMPTSIVCFTK